MSLSPYGLEDDHPNFQSCGSRYYPRGSHPLLSPHERTLLSTLLNPHNYLRSRHLDDIEAKMVSHIGKDGFQVCMDVQHFEPNEIEVKTENNSIVVHAEHEQKKDDHGHISRQFTRRYELPEGFKAEDVTSSLSSDGVLIIKCPPVPAIAGLNVRHVQIQHTGPAKLNIMHADKKIDEK